MSIAERKKYKIPIRTCYRRVLSVIHVLDACCQENTCWTRIVSNTRVGRARASRTRGRIELTYTSNVNGISFVIFQFLITNTFNFLTEKCLPVE